MKKESKKIKNAEELEDALNDLRCDMIDAIMDATNEYDYDSLSELETDELYDRMIDVCQPTMYIVKK